MIFIISLSLSGCVIKTDSHNGNKMISNIEYTTYDKTETTKEESKVDLSNSDSTETKNQIIISDLPDDFVKCTKYIGKDIYTLGVDTSLWDFHAVAQEVGESSLYGHTGIVSMGLGWDNKTITDVIMLVEGDEYMQGEEYDKIYDKLKDIFGAPHEVVDGMNDFYGKGEYAFRLSRGGAGIGWNEKNREKFDKKEPTTEESTITEAPKKSPEIGMTAEEVEKSLWGKPSDINKTTTQYGTTEQWVYRSSVKNKYIYFKNGIVTAIQE